jgi:hypothetical protein
MIATAVSTLPLPLPDTELLASPWIRTTPVGRLWAVAWTARSAETKETLGSFRTSPSRRSGMFAA